MRKPIQGTVTSRPGVVLAAVCLAGLLQNYFNERMVFLEDLAHHMELTAQPAGRGLPDLRDR